jgi:hypothetical protein
MPQTYDELVRQKKITGRFATRSVHIGGNYLAATESLRLKSHSPDGFNWGYSGSGPAQLALAILLYFFPENFCLNNYQEFKSDIIAGLPMGKDFEITGATVIDWAITKHIKELSEATNEA